MKRKHADEWKPVFGFESDYEVSSSGQVKSIKFNKEKILSQAKTNYPSVSLWLNGKLTVKKVHRIVAETWIPNPKEHPEVNHKDGNRFNNAVENLEWVTRLENAAHAALNGLMPSGESHKNSKLTLDAVNKIRKSAEPQRSLAKKFGVSQSLISMVKNKLHWRAA